MTWILVLQHQCWRIYMVRSLFRCTPDVTISKRPTCLVSRSFVRGSCVHACGHSSGEISFHGEVIIKLRNQIEAREDGSAMRPCSCSSCLARAAGVQHLVSCMGLIYRESLRAKTQGPDRTMQSSIIHDRPQTTERLVTSRSWNCALCLSWYHVRDVTCGPSY
jgi:hypothetical protein